MTASSFPVRGRRRVAAMFAAAAALTCLLAPQSGRAAGVQADTAPGRSLGTTVAVSGATYTIDGGSRVGGNLFHSFSSFSLALGQTARWTYSAGGASSIVNVVNRVTGGSPSQILGTLDSTALPNASFFFINPAGIVFGAGSRVNVPGAAHFSTASFLTFADGAVFRATTASGSVLTMASPTAFGFLGGEGGVKLTGVQSTFARPAGSLSFVANSLSVSGSTIKTGHLDLIAAGDQTLSVGISDPLAGGAFGGAISVASSKLSTLASPTSDGIVRMGGGKVSFADSTLSTQVTQVQTATAVRAAGSIEIVAGSLDLTQGAAVTSAGTGLGHAGDVAVTAGKVILSGGSQITSSGATGGAGALTVATTSFEATGQSGVSASALGTGPGGSVEVTASGDVSLADNSVIASVAKSTGKGGDVTVSAANIALKGATISASTLSDGAAGSVSVTATEKVDLNNGGTIQAAAIKLPTQAHGADGNAGQVYVHAASLSLTNGGIITTSVNGRGHAGNIVIDSGSVLVTGALDKEVLGKIKHIDSQIASDAKATVSGDAGAVSITADTLTASDEGFISTSSSGHGRGGSIQVTATGAISLSSNSSIIAAARSKGKGGDVAVTAANIALSGATISASAFSDGAAGSVSVIASGAIELSQGGTIQSAAVKVATRPRGSDGDAGQVYVKAASLDLTNGGIITSATNGKGSAGNIIIDVGAVSVSGAIDTIVLGQPKHTPSQITSSAKSATGGRAGTLIINADSLNISSGGLIETNSQNANAAGAITLNVPAISIDGAGSRVSSVNSGTSGGDAGAIAVHTDPITLSNGGAITTDSRTGAAGGIDLIFDHGGLLVLEGAVDQGVITTTSATATAGRITIAGPAAIILNGGRIRALGPFQGAQVDIGGGVLVESSDRPNSIDVAGALTLNTQIADIAEAVTASDLSFLDASKVLRGQCATQTASGETSRLTTRLSGPYEPSPRGVASRRSSLRRPLSPCPGAG